MRGAGAERLPETLSLQVLSTGLRFLLIKLPRKMFPWLSSSGNWGLFGFRHSPCPVFLPSQRHHLEVPGLNFLVCFCRSIILPLAWKHSSDPPCRVEQKGQVFLQAGALYQEAAQRGQPCPSLSRPALERVFLGKEGWGTCSPTGGDKLVVASPSPAIPPRGARLSSYRKLLQPQDPLAQPQSVAVERLF